MSMTEEAKGPKDYLAAVMRRKLRLIIPAVLIVAISLIVAMVMPPVYRSTGTVLIEEPEIPREFIRSTITSFAAERLQTIQQRVMTTQNLISIINKFNLYADERKRKPISEIAGTFRDKIAMQLVSAEAVDPRSGQSRKAVIAFNVSFDDGNRAVAQKVANELVSLYLNENLRIRREKAAETTGFLGEEADRLGKQVSDLEARMADFKRRNSGVLPDQLGLNMSALSRTEAQLSDANRRLQALEERRIVLQSQLSQLNPHGVQVIDGQTVMSPVDRLKALETRLISMRGTYGAQHPDVVKAEHEIEVLKKETGAGTSVELAEEAAANGRGRAGGAAQALWRQVSGCRETRPAGQEPALRYPECEGHQGRAGCEARQPELHHDPRPAQDPAGRGGGGEQGARKASSRLEGI